MPATPPKASIRIALSTALVALSLTGCTRFLQPDPLNKTESIVNGTQITRGPVRGTASSGFADTTVPLGNTFEPAVGDPFDAAQLSSLGTADAALPELQGIDFGAEQGFIDQAQLGLQSQGIGNDPAAFAADIGQTVYFATDSSDLNERARETLRRQAAWLEVNQDARITIEGHADERGTREYNLALGDRRASATRGYLIAVGIDEGRIDKISYGKERPVALGSDPEAWARNRRTETVIDGGGGFGGGVAGSSFPSGDVSGIGNLTLDAPGGDSSGIGNLVLDAPGSVSSDPFASNDPFSDPFLSSLDTTSDPLFPDPLSGGALDATAPGTITYDPGPSTVYGSGDIGGTVSPTVFDANQAIGPVTTQGASTTVTGATRIEDVSVDDLLRDPSLIDRIGTPASSVTTPGS